MIGVADTSAIVAAKAAIRKAALARRDALAPEDRSAGSAALSADDVERIAGPVAGLVVSGFWPIRSEIDPRPLMTALEARGARLALPRIVDGRLEFRPYRSGDLLVPAGFGTFEPSGDQPIVAPDVLLVPLSAFDATGGRTGYGKGFYDTAIAALQATKPIRAIGLAFSVQEVPEVPREPHDKRLDAVLTEVGVRAWQPV
jgi:5-formyltetrahydrofolate cyclo-ligase